MKKLHILCREAFYNPESRSFIVINDILSVATIVSILGIILESMVSLSQYHSFFYVIEYTAVIFFTLEYIGRILGTKKKLAYIFSFFGIIDLLSILPTYFHVANLTPLKSARSLRILRMLRILRIAKVARIENESIQRQRRDFGEIYKLNIKIYLLSLISVVVLLGSLVYVFEHDHGGGFYNIPVSMLWVLSTILEGPYLKAAPETWGGITISLLARLVGLILLGFLIHVIGDIVNRLLLGIKKDKTAEEINGDF